jgi:hypothetical protein
MDNIDLLIVESEPINVTPTKQSGVVVKAEDFGFEVQLDRDKSIRCRLSTDLAVKEGDSITILEVTEYKRSNQRHSIFRVTKIK